MYGRDKVYILEFGWNVKKKKRLLGRNWFRRKDNIERYLKNQDNIRGFIWLMTMTNAGNVTG